jgi:hypothetical protein
VKFAVLYAGPYRGNDSILQNHKLAFGDIDVDVYVSCFEHYFDDWKRSGWDAKEYFITPYIDFNLTNWAKYRNNPAGQSGFWQFWNLKSVIDSIPKDYDYYIKSRNDIVFNHSFTFDINSLKPNTIYSASESFHKKEWNENNWINDEFYMGCENTMKVISNFVTDFYKKERHLPNIPYASNESQLRIWLNENNISVDKIYKFPYTKNNNGINTPSGLSGFQLEKI